VKTNLLLIFLLILLFPIHVFSQETEIEKGNWILGLYVSSLSSSIEQELTIDPSFFYNGTNVKNKESLSSTTSIIIGGYRTEESRSYLRCTGTEYDDFSITAFAISSDQYFSINETSKLYGGLSIGYGGLTWNKDIGGAKTKDESANSLVGGIQAGIEQRFTENLIFDIGFFYLFTYFKTELLAPNGELNITVKNLRSLYAGLNYVF